MTTGPYWITCPWSQWPNLRRARQRNLDLRGTMIEAWPIADNWKVQAAWVRAWKVGGRHLRSVPAFAQHLDRLNARDQLLFAAAYLHLLAGQKRSLRGDHVQVRIESRRRIERRLPEGYASGHDGGFLVLDHLPEVLSAARLSSTCWKMSRGYGGNLQPSHRSPPGIAGPWHGARPSKIVSANLGPSDHTRPRHVSQIAKEEISGGAQDQTWKILASATPIRAFPSGTFPPVWPEVRRRTPPLQLKTLMPAGRPEA